MQPYTPRGIQNFYKAKDHDIKFYCSNDIKSKIKILDHKHAEGTAKNPQDNKVLRHENLKVELAADVKEECEKIGAVESVTICENHPHGGCLDTMPKTLDPSAELVVFTTFLNLWALGKVFYIVKLAGGREKAHVVSLETMVNLNEMAEIILNFEDKKLPIHYIPAPEGVCGLPSRQLIYRLSHRDLKSRLGSRECASEVKRCAFFRGINRALVRC
nr:putative LOV domain-containing protein [Tanacetum cinerariifolium]